MRDRLNAEKLAEIEKRLVIVETVLNKLIDTLNKREDKMAEFLAKKEKGGVQE